MDTNTIKPATLAALLISYQNANHLLALEIAERKSLRQPTTHLEERLQWNRGEARGMLRDAGII